MSAKPRKEKKSKTSTNLPSTSSTPDNQQGSVFDEEELERQYQTYKKQFDEWTSKHKGVVSEKAFNDYVDQFKKWEKEIDQRRKLLKSHRKSMSKTIRDEATTLKKSEVPANTPTNVAAVDPAFDPANAMNMMMMMASMMMPFMMMNNPGQGIPTNGNSANQQPPPPPAPQQIVAQPPTTFSSNAALYKPVNPQQNPTNMPPMMPKYHNPPPAMPQNFSSGPPAAVNAMLAANSMPQTGQSSVNYDRFQRGQRSNGRFFREGDDRYSRKSNSPANYNNRGRFRNNNNRNEEHFEDTWYNRCRDRQMENSSNDRSNVFNGAYQPYNNNNYNSGQDTAGGSVSVFRGANYEPLTHGQELWNQSGLGANDFSMKKQQQPEQRYSRF